jgi:hypothetical protein
MPKIYEFDFRRKRKVGSDERIAMQNPMNRYSIEKETR